MVSGTLPTCAATRPGVRRMPIPITPPTVIAAPNPAPSILSRCPPRGADAASDSFPIWFPHGYAPTDRSIAARSPTCAGTYLFHLPPVGLARGFVARSLPLLLIHH